MITICMNDRQYVITDIQEHLYVRKSEYVLKLLRGGGGGGGGRD